jgi:hypothetical protein
MALERIAEEINKKRIEENKEHLVKTEKELDKEKETRK